MPTLSTKHSPVHAKHARMQKRVPILPSGYPKMSMPRLPQNTASNYGHKVHTLVDSVSNLVMGLFVSTSSLNDNPLFIPLLKVIDTIVQFRFKKYAADKGYDDKDNYHFVVDDLKAEPVIPHREETKTSPSSEL